LERLPEFAAAIPSHGTLASPVNKSEEEEDGEDDEAGDEFSEDEFDPVEFDYENIRRPSPEGAEDQPMSDGQLLLLNELASSSTAALEATESGNSIRWGTVAVIFFTAECQMGLVTMVWPLVGDF
jgi:hypothetical protein